MANYDLSKADPEFPRPGPSISSSKAHLPACFIDIPNIYNFRHIGAHQLPSGRQTRTDLIFRSAEPSPITEAGVAALQQLGITTVFDLRSATEIERNKEHTPVTQIPGTTRLFVPVFGDARPDEHVRRMGYYGEEGSGGFVKAYMEILQMGASAYRAVLEHLRDRPSEPCLVHCTAGKDRTGVVIALVLGLVGVAPKEIAEEYALTELGLADWLPTIIESILKNPVMEGDRGKVERMVSAKEENMAAFLEEMDSVWGGVEGYLRKALGFSKEDLEKITTNVTEAS